MEKNIFARLISGQLNIKEQSVAGTLALLDEGCTIPFISRYRKERTGGLDEVQIAAISESYERLKEIHKLIPDTPLVLHGASTVLPEFVDKCNQYGGQIPGAQGVPEDMIKEAAKYGVCKVNIDTDVRLAMTAEIRKYLIEHPADFDPRLYLGPARQAIQEMVQHKIRDVLNSSGTMAL